ncbi:MAG: radical SAM protein [bacterium]|nr:radical SAM protein [bacterium]
MTINEITAKSILRKHKRIDSWFVARYGMNLYRGCTHNCVYCDGRAEGYYVDDDFGETVAVKINALEILQRELDPKRKRKPFKRGFVMLCGGVGDSYQPVDETYGLSRKALQLIQKHNFPVQILTKSTLIERDIDLLEEINRQTRAVVSFSFSTVDEKIGALLEPGVPSPVERLNTIRLFKSKGIPCGMFLMPVIPYITDGPEMLEMSVKAAKEAGVDFIIFAGLTLKTGRQKDYFMRVLRQNFPAYQRDYDTIYRGNKWGTVTENYYMGLNNAFHNIARRYKMPVRIPAYVFKDMLDENDLVVVLLEHIDYILKSRGETSPFGYAAYSISRLKEPLSSMKDQLMKIKGVGNVTESVIAEILETGDSSYYRSLTMV